MLDKEYKRDSNAREQREAFHMWLWTCCALLVDVDGAEENKLRALSSIPCRKVCLFKSMIAYGSHFKVDLEEGGRSMRHLIVE